MVQCYMANGWSGATVLVHREHNCRGRRLPPQRTQKGSLSTEGCSALTSGQRQGPGKETCELRSSQNPWIPTPEPWPIGIGLVSNRKGWVICGGGGGGMIL